MAFSWPECVFVVNGIVSKWMAENRRLIFILNENGRFRHVFLLLRIVMFLAMFTIGKGNVRIISFDYLLLFLFR